MNTFRYVAMLVGMAVLAACGAGDRGEPEFTVVPGGAAGEVSYPLDDYQAMGDQRAAIDTAQAVLVQRCLAGRGLDLPLGKAADEPNRPDWYGVTTEAAAREAGYNAVGRPVADLPFVQRVAQEARPLFDGCFDEANRTITAGSPRLEDVYLVTTLEKRALKQSQQDSRVLAVTGEWQACMKAEGHTFADGAHRRAVQGTHGAARYVGGRHDRLPAAAGRRTRRPVGCPPAGARHQRRQRQRCADRALSAARTGTLLRCWWGVSSNGRG